MGSRIGKIILSAQLVISLAAPALAACREDVVQLRGDWGQARFTIEVADTGPERAQGLMHVEQMPRSAGMLFVYDRPGTVAFWMRNTLIPLDMIFADAQGVVQRVHSNAIPLDETPIPGGDGIQYVLEINGGLSEAMGINEGTQMQHPSINVETAAWSCSE
jgi:uncharacterized membrane protein (UPF0127 family)